MKEKRALLRAMVREQIQARGLLDPALLAAMESVGRDLFVPKACQEKAFQDTPLPIGHGATISQPYVVALMTSLLEVAPGITVLEVGTGSGYQAAILAALGCRVFSIERLNVLSRRAARTLEAAGLGHSVHLAVGDGSQGWPKEAPFQRVLLSAATERVPGPLFDQLQEGGTLVAPVGPSNQQILCRYQKRAADIELTEFGPVRFVPFIRDS